MSSSRGIDERSHRVQPLRVRDPRGPVPDLRAAAGRGAGVPQRRGRLLGPVPPRRRGGGVPRQRAVLVGARRVPRSGRVRSQRAPDDVVPRHGPAHARSHARPRLAGVHAASRPRPRAPHPRAHPAAPRSRAGAGQLRLHRRHRRQAADGRHLRADRRAFGRPGRGAPALRPAGAPRGGQRTTCPPRASRPPSASSPTTPTCSPSAGPPRPTTSPLRSSPPRSTATGSPTTRSWASCS